MEKWELALTKVTRFELAYIIPRMVIHKAGLVFPSLLITLTYRFLSDIAPLPSSSPPLFEKSVRIWIQWIQDCRILYRIQWEIKLFVTRTKM